MRNIFFSLLLFFTTTSCVQNSEELPVIPFYKISAIDQKHEIPLDSIVERTEIIRFTSDIELIIGKIKEVFESKDNFFLIADNRILRFSKNGRFINPIGKQGKGPGEYLSPWALDVDDVNQCIYVMDYFGRKMLCYRFDGAFDNKFSLPESFNINGFRLYQGKILFTSDANAIIPEIYIYDQNTDELLQVSSCEREMHAGEAIMGTTFLMGNMEHPLLFHYFNDTVFSVIDKRLNPQYLLQFGKLKIKFEDLNVESGKKADGPRVQIYNMVSGKQFTFIQYGVTRLNGNKNQTQITGIYRNDLSFYLPSVNLISKEKPLFTIHSGKSFNAGYGNTLLTTISALDVLEAEPDFDISEGDNPLILKYYLK